MNRSMYPLFSLGVCLIILLFLVATIPIHAQPYAYVTNFATVSVIDTKTNTVTATIPFGNGFNA